MDHDGQFEKEGTGMSHMQLGGVDLCDNLPNPQALTAKPRNLNETNTLTHTQSLYPSQNDDRGGSGLIQETSVINRGKEGCTGRASEQDGEEDMDEVMKEDEEEEESEGSSCLIRCQSPDTPMTDSSFSETGSLLETPFPFSPGTSPEPASPVIPEVSTESMDPTRQTEMSRNDVKVDSCNSNTEPVVPGAVVTTGPTASTTQTKTSNTRSDSQPGSVCSSERTTYTTAERHTSATKPRSNSMPTTFFSSTTAAPLSPFRARRSSITGTGYTSPTGHFTLDWKRIFTSTPVPPRFLVPTRTTGPISTHDLLESLELLAKRGDEPYLPQYLHQIAEAFFLHKDYQRAMWCLHLEKLYHQRVLHNLNALQEQWERRCGRAPSHLTTEHLSTLRYICLTHNRPSVTDTVCASQKVLRPTTAEGGALLPSSSAPLSEDSSHSQTSCPVKPSINLADGPNPPEMSEEERGESDRLLQGRVCGAGDGGESEDGKGGTISVPGNEVHPFLTGGMDQSKPAEQQGGDLGLAQEKEAKREEEESEVEEAAEALEMEDDGEEEEEERHELGDSPLCPRELPVETLISGAEVEVQHLHQEAITEEKLHEDTQLQESAHLDQRTHLPQEAQIEQQEQAEEDVEEEEEEEDYELEQADLIREAAVLDDMAKLITVEEMCPAPGLVSILKKRQVYVEEVKVSRPDKPPAKRRVHFKVPDDGYEQDVGGGDSCLLLFLLCMVTVVISVGGTALYCALGDAHSSVCQDFSRNADFYMGQLQRGIAQIQHWFTPGS